MNDAQEAVVLDLFRQKRISIRNFWYSFSIAKLRSTTTAGDRSIPESSAQQAILHSEKT